MEQQIAQVVRVESVEAAYSKVLQATTDVQNISLDYFKAKENLEKEILLATARGEIEGKNQQAREAAAYEMFKGEHKSMAVLEQDLEIAKNKLSLARIELDCLRDCIRVMELTKAG